jgi:UDPglucose--hexose-1-phosphate uridylyltransferase
VPELRIDPLSGLRTIVAGERSDRPGAFPGAGPRPPVDPERDPFLEGHEAQTPPEVAALRPDGAARDEPGWRVRVVPNLYPALSEDDVQETEDAGGGFDPLAEGRGEPDLFASRPASGAHEVIVNSPRPVSSLADLSAEELETAMGVWRERMGAHRSAACVHLIVNEGEQAGASLPHTHAQLYALEFVPALIARERERFTAYSNRTHGRNLLEDLVQEEVRRRERLVAVDSEAVALCPFAARVPFQLQLVPRRPAARFEDPGPLAAGLLHDVLGRLARALGGDVPPLNLWVRTAPRGAEHFCWRIDVLPRLAQPAGLEVGAGIDLCPLAPERAAELLRDAGD